MRLRGEDIAHFARMWAADPSELLRPVVDLISLDDVLAN